MHGRGRWGHNVTCGSPSGLYVSWSPQVIQALHTDPAAYIHVATHGFVTVLSLALTKNLSAQARPSGSVLLPSVGINLGHGSASFALHFARTDISSHLILLVVPPLIYTRTSLVLLGFPFNSIESSLQLLLYAIVPL